MGHIELRAFGKIRELFAERMLSQPYLYPLEQTVTAYDLLEKLQIAQQEVESVFINGKACDLISTIRPGDRVAFVPCGIPGVVRFALGIHGSREEK